MSESPDTVVAWTTLPPEADAAALAHTLVEDQLAACVAIVGAIHSVYRWQGSVEASDEQLLMIKTASRRVNALRDRIADLHPYDTPEFIVTVVHDGHPGYLRWIVDSTGDR